MRSVFVFSDCEKRIIPVFTGHYIGPYRDIQQLNPRLLLTDSSFAAAYCAKAAGRLSIGADFISLSSARLQARRQGRRATYFLMSL